MDQRLDLGSRVARGDVTGLVAQEPVTNLRECGSLLEDVNGAFLYRILGYTVRKRKKWNFIVLFGEARPTCRLS